MSRPCAYCYCQLAPDKVLCCGKCKVRAFCSKQCQKADWKSSHKLWCGKVGELGVDFEIRDCGSKGLGVFPLRNLKQGDKILVERCIIQRGENDSYHAKDLFEIATTLQKGPPSILSTVKALSPVDNDDILVKFSNNVFGLSPGQGLCLTASRFNHSCVPNCDRYFLHDQNLMIISASCAIREGEELTISYAELAKGRKESFAMYRSRLQDCWHFSCTCRACQNPEVAAMLLQCSMLDEQIVTLGSTGREREAYQVGEELIRLYDQVGMTPLSYERTYYDMFQMTVVRKQTMPAAIHCIQKCLEYKMMAVGGTTPEHDGIARIRSFVENPSSHRCYLQLEGVR